ncbi:MAG: glutamate--tRNA ligase, partial [Anaerolineae bacterium]|nr:glutamate--tRNA ligase [Anaerolineae bacterium]
MDRPVRVRFAPSPTGPLHIGGARTALFTWLLARHYGGTFVLRIEDTDRSRYVPGSVELITGGLRWLGLDWDEGPEVGGDYGPYFQSERAALYQHWANWLVEQDKAYRCYCTKERLDEIREHGVQGYDRHCRYLSPEERAAHEANGDEYVIRFKMALEGTTTVPDMIRGDMTVDNSTLQDLVLLKSDGFPTYHLANVVDDHLMEISHVTRSTEWIPTAPIHYRLYEAFGWEMPRIAHLPIILNPDGKGKLSKRTAGFTENGHKVPVLLHEFREAGYLPEAVVNFLTNIGWSFGDDREVFTIQETIERFDLSRVSPAAGIFPLSKLDWLNGVYIREMDPADLAPLLREPLERAGYVVDEATLRQIAPLVQERIHSLNDVVEKAGFFFEDAITLDIDDLMQKNMDAAATKTALTAVQTALTGLPDFGA